MVMKLYEIEIKDSDDAKTKKIKKEFIKLRKQFEQIEKEINEAMIVTQELLNTTITI